MGKWPKPGSGMPEGKERCAGKTHRKAHSSLRSAPLAAPVFENQVDQQVHGPCEHERYATNEGITLLQFLGRRCDQEHAPDGDGGIEVPHQNAPLSAKILVMCRGTVSWNSRQLPDLLR